jgi:hypothetical protein
MRTNAARLGFRRRQSPASITSCCGEGDFSLPKPGQRRDPGLEIGGNLANADQNRPRIPMEASWCL